MEKTTGVRFDRQTTQALEIMARESGMNKTEIIRSAVLAFIAKNKKPADCIAAVITARTAKATKTGAFKAKINAR